MVPYARWSSEDDNDDDEDDDDDDEDVNCFYSRVEQLMSEAPPYK